MVKSRTTKRPTKVYLKRSVEIARKKPVNSIKGQETKHVKYYIRGQTVFAVPKGKTKLIHE